MRGIQELHIGIDAHIHSIFTLDLYFRFFFTQQQLLPGHASICMNDGYLQVDLKDDSGWPDVPGAYHDFKGSMNFADGHAVIHKWVTSALKIPVRYGFGWPQGGYPPFPGGHNNADLLWWKAHTASPDP